MNTVVGSVTQGIAFIGKVKNDAAANNSRAAIKN